MVENDRIIAVGQDGRDPKPAAGDTVFDLRDKSLMPGMVEGHFHAGYLNVGSMTDSGVSIRLGAQQTRRQPRCGADGAGVRCRCSLESMMHSPTKPPKPWSFRNA